MCRAVCRARTPQGHGLRVPLLPAARCSRRDMLPAGPAGHPPAQSSSWKSVRGNTLSSLSLPTAHRRRTVWVTEGRRAQAEAPSPGARLGRGGGPEPAPPGMRLLRWRSTHVQGTAVQNQSGTFLVPTGGCVCRCHIPWTVHDGSTDHPSPDWGHPDAAFLWGGGLGLELEREPRGCVGALWGPVAGQYMSPWTAQLRWPGHRVDTETHL